MTLFTCFTEQTDKFLITDTFNEYDVTHLIKLQDIERMTLSDEEDVLIFTCVEINDVALQLLLRIMKFAPIPIIVQAQTYQQETLMRLLKCGRVTFELADLDLASVDLDRLAQRIELAKLRFSVAHVQQQKIEQLESALDAQKLIAKVKAKLQLNGLTEPQAHKLLQKQAMEAGISVEQFILQFPLN
ncbi:ANTAR domain-containing response regulator [Shewanella sp. UCD-KL12]|uniref:ANTAR domain-containing response regulator n=1 Tax=Shewanella sp. UCD-KL12 TaxID=1917163 RepID=UPI000970A0F7|nr:ANTAR domain-containing protein [Shewanella sp. UCD-KL12]